MRLEKILQQERFNIPRPLGTKNESLKQLVEADLEAYYQTVVTSTDLLFVQDKLNQRIVSNALVTSVNAPGSNSCSNVVGHLKHCITMAICWYLDGQPHEAYRWIAEALEHENVNEILLQTRLDVMPRYTRLYRIRSMGNSNRKVVKRKEIFHIPFDKRHRVASQRFSIPGFPCLYLADDLNGAFCEVKPQKKHIESVVGAGLRNVRPLTFINLQPISISKLVKKEQRHTLITDKLATLKEIENYGKIWPLIVSCYYKIEYKDVANFKAEYIIPQLILQWFKNNGADIDGIKYLSVSRFHLFKKNGEGFNYVFPIHKSQDHGLCNLLRHSFEVSPVLDGKKYRIHTYRNFKNIQRMEKSIKKLFDDKRKMHIIK